MSSKRKKTGSRNLAVLAAFDEKQNLVVEKTLAPFDYYEELHPFIDDEEYRRKHNIRHLHGKLFNSDGNLFQQFYVEFGPNGDRIHGRIVHDDGTVSED